MAEAEAAPATQALLKGSPDGIVIGDIPVTDPGFAGEVTSVSVFVARRLLDHA
jgi:cell shape-determining protein MreC